MSNPVFDPHSKIALNFFADRLTRRAWLVVGLVAAMGLSACGGSDSDGGCAINRTNYDRLTHNMTLEQVTAVYGCSHSKVIDENTAAIAYLWEGTNTASAVLFTKTPNVRLTYKNYQDSAGVLIEKKYE